MNFSLFRLELAEIARAVVGVGDGIDEHRFIGTVVMAGCDVLPGVALERFELAVIDVQLPFAERPPPCLALVGGRVEGLFYAQAAARGRPARGVESRRASTLSRVTYELCPSRHPISCPDESIWETRPGDTPSIRAASAAVTCSTVSSPA